MTEEIIDCVMCPKPAITTLQGEELINASLCFDCANKLQELIEHCELDWSFRMGVNYDCKVKVTQQ